MGFRLWHCVPLIVLSACTNSSPPTPPPTETNNSTAVQQPPPAPPPPDRINGYWRGDIIAQRYAEGSFCQEYDAPTGTCVSIFRLISRTPTELVIERRRLYRFLYERPDSLGDAIAGAMLERSTFQPQGYELVVRQRLQIRDEGLCTPRQTAVEDADDAQVIVIPDLSRPNANRMEPTSEHLNAARISYRSKLPQIGDVICGRFTGEGDRLDQSLFIDGMLQPGAPIRFWVVPLNVPLQPVDNGAT